MYNLMGGECETFNVSKTEKFGSLDGIRVLACIGIVLMHVKSNISVEPSDSWLMTNVISFTGDFVLLFMMISAFSMSCGYYRKFREGTITTEQFYKKRYLRIFPFFALLVIIDVLQTFVTQGFALTNAMKAELYEAYADLTLAFGLLPDAGIDVVGVGWFLGVIFLFYMLYPFFTFILRSKLSGWVALLIVAGFYYVGEEYFVAVKGCSFGSSNILYCAPYFITGGIIYLYRTAVIRLMDTTVFRLLMFVVTIGYTVAFFVFPEYRVRLFSNILLYSLWVLFAVSEAGIMRGRTLLNNKIMKFLSGISMEIYLCHMMFFRIVEKFHIEDMIGDVDLCYWVTCAFVFTGAVSFALIWKRVEKKLISSFTFASQPKERKA